MADDEDVLDWDKIRTDMRQLAVVENNVTILGKRKAELRGRLEALTRLVGVPDEKEHSWLHFPEPIEGYTGLKIEKRVSSVLDEEKAEEVLRSIVVDKDGPITLWDQCIEYVPQLDEDAVMAAHYNGQITAEQIDEMYPKKITEAFVPQKPRRR